MSKEYIFEQTLSMLGSVHEQSIHATINPMIPSSPAIPLRSLDLGLTIPTVEALPSLEISSQEGGEGEFEILGVLGSGGMGVVELARQHAMQREVVIKRPHSTDASNHQISALVKEGVLTGRLEHPNIIPVHFLGRTDKGLPALVMKRIVGTNWRDMIHDDDHPFWKNVQGDRIDWHLRVFLQVSNAIDFAHSKGVLHRDIKPENVMLGDFGEVYMLDWGIGLLLDEKGEANPRQFAGTPSYMAPEMLGDRLTIQTDIYLLGATLHEVLTKKFRHEGEDFSEIIFQAKHSRPYAYGLDIPEELADICNRATHRDPAQRYESVAAFREAIEEHLRHRNALHLIDTAVKRLETLKEQTTVVTTLLEIVDRVALHELATECRFALREALRIWPDALRARAALRECTLIMAKMELDLGNLPSAELLLADVEELPEEFSLRIQELREEIIKSTEERARLRALEHNFDSRVAATSRSFMMLALSLVTLMVASGYMWFQGELIVRTHKGAFLTGGTLIFTCLVVAIYFRDILMETSFNRRLTTLYFISALGILLNRSLGFFISTSVEAAFSTDMILLAVVFGVAGATIERRLFFGALPYALGIPLAMIWPAWAYVFMVSSFVGSTLITSLIWTKVARLLARDREIDDHSSLR